MLFIVACGGSSEETVVKDTTTTTIQDTTTTTIQDTTTTTIPPAPTVDFNIVEIYNTKLGTDLCSDASDIDATPEPCLKKYRDNLELVLSYEESLQKYITGAWRTRPTSDGWKVCCRPTRSQRRVGPAPGRSGPGPGSPFPARPSGAAATPA